MHHGPNLMLATLVACIILAFALGAGARMLRLPALIGYMAAGILISPHVPEFVAERGMVGAMAEVGVALLLFGVGLHFRPADLVAVWRVAVPGALAQIALATTLGSLVGGGLLGLNAGAAMAFGLALAISSTAVATKALEERGRLGGEAGRLALGWLVMQDLVVVFGLVLLPAIGGRGPDAEGSLLWQLAKAAFALAAFGGLMWVVGRRALPWALVRVARGGSRELFTLAVLAIALGIAFLASTLFGVSFALGAFFAGVVLGESDVGHQAAADATPLQRIFTAIFFVSVGMLLDPAAIAAAPIAAIASFLSVMIAVGGGTLLLLLLLRVRVRVAVMVAGALGQIGEFSFLLVEVAVQQGVLPEEARGPVLAAAIGSILMTPLMLRAMDALAPRLEALPWLDGWSAGQQPTATPAPAIALEDHAIVVGTGRVGSVILRALLRHHLPVICIEEDRVQAERLMAAGVPVVWGDATRPEVFAAAAAKSAKLLVLALPGPLEARAVLEMAREANPAIRAVVRSHSEAEAGWLEAEDGVELVMMGEREVALGMADYAMQQLGVAASTAQATVDVFRARRFEDLTSN